MFAVIYNKLKFEVFPESSGLNKKQKILIFGIAPLPFEDVTQHNTCGKRTWQFAKVLADEKYEVVLVCSRISAAYTEKIPFIEFKKPKKNLTVYFLREENFNKKTLLKVYRKFQPGVIIGVNVHAAALACQIRTGNIPVWADLNGHYMTEAQAKCANYSNNKYLKWFWRNEKTAIINADKFSVVSDAQKYATIGELGALGRLNAATCGYEFVHTIRNGVDIETPVAEQEQHDDFIILWSGSYNNWVDVETMFKGIESAMQENQRIKFISTGGEVTGHDENTYWKILGLVNISDFKERFILKGWISKKELFDLYKIADLAILSEKEIYEGILGCRARVLEWLKMGVPVLMNEVSELSRILREKGAIFTYNTGDSSNLKEKILYLLDHRDELRACADRGREYVLNKHNFRVTLSPLLKWLENPHKAPD